MRKKKNEQQLMAGYEINIETSKELYRHLKSFLVNPLPPFNKQINGSSRKNDRENAANRIGRY